MNEEILKEILEALKAATDEIFLEQQAKLHVVSGDVEPWLSNAFDTAMEKLAALMVSILEKQPKLEIESLKMKDGTVYDASKLADDYETFLALMKVYKYINENH